MIWWRLYLQSSVWGNKKVKPGCSLVSKPGAGIIFIENAGPSLRACVGDLSPTRSLSRTDNVFLTKMDVLLMGMYCENIPAGLLQIIRSGEQNVIFSY